MIDVLLKLIVFIFLLLGYLIFLFSYRVFNGTSTRLILLSKFEDKDNGNLVPDVIFSQSIIRVIVGFWALGLAIHTAFIFYFYSNIFLNTWLESLIYFLVSMVFPLIGYFFIYVLNDKAVEKLQTALDSESETVLILKNLFHTVGQKSIFLRFLRQKHP